MGKYTYGYSEKKLAAKAAKRKMAGLDYEDYLRRKNATRSRRRSEANRARRQAMGKNYVVVKRLITQ